MRSALRGGMTRLCMDGRIAYRERGRVVATHALHLPIGIQPAHRAARADGHTDIAAGHAHGRDSP